MNGLEKKYACPICGAIEMTDVSPGSFDTCDVCGWEDDLVQYHDRDEEGGANSMSFNQAKKAWEEGRPIT